MIHFDVTLEIEGPLLTRDSRAATHGVDAVALRYPDGRFAIPDSLIKGRVRDAWADLTEALRNGGNEADRTRVRAMYSFDSDRLLGIGADEAKRRNLPDANGARGALQFSDLVTSQSIAGSRQVRVQLDEVRGAADDQMLLELEAAGRPGERMTFTGTIAASLKVDEAERVRRGLEAGLRWIPAIGGLTGVGYGVVRGATVTRRAASNVTIDYAVKAVDALHVALQSDKPICILGPTAVHQNVFESLDYIPGNVLKGAIATTVLRHCGIHDGAILTEEALKGAGVTERGWLALARHLASIRVRHAFPSAGNHRACAIPLSMARLKQEDGRMVLQDMALVPTVGLVAGAVPAFAPDWKGDEGLAAAYGWAESHRETRVRTAIDRSKRRAKDEALFAHERVQLKEPASWRTVLDLGGIAQEPERREVAAALLSLLTVGVGPAGKSKATLRRCEAEQATPKEDEAPNIATTLEPFRESGECTWILTLQTETLIGSPEVFDRDGARAMYDQAFRELSGGALKISRFFAQQQLAGGEWLHERFRGSRGYSYAPYLLTRPGSTFVLTCPEGGSSAASCLIAGWIASGLPLDDGATTYYELGDTEHTWKQCPFVRENGYGEIACNLGLDPAAERGN